MASVLPHPRALGGSEITAKILKTWLVDEKKTRAGVIGVDCALQIVSVQTFKHSLNGAALRLGLSEAVRASASAVVAYCVAEGMNPGFDTQSTERLVTACEALNLTLLDVMIFSDRTPRGWLSARQQSLL